MFAQPAPKSMKRFMKSIPVTELIGTTSSLMTWIKQGEEITLTEKGKPLAKIIPTATSYSGPRPSGLAKGEFVVPDDFNDPLPENLLREFEGR